AELGVIGRAEHMHRIMDAERDATLAYLDCVTLTVGGRRGRKAVATETGGLVYAHTRHATSRAGDPCPHDHVLLVNVIEMKDGWGGWKAADTALWREHLHAATMVGRVAAARVAVELGYGIEPDNGPSGRLRHWRIAGVPDEVIDLHSKRAAEIDAEVKSRGEDSYRARRVAARATRQAKEEGVETELIDRWQAELASIGWPVERLAASIDSAAQKVGSPPKLTLKTVRRMLGEVLSGEGELARKKVFSRRHVLVEVAPHLFGQDPRLLGPIVDRALQDPEAIPLVAVTGAREPPYALASVLATEQAVAHAVARQVERTDAPTTTPTAVQEAIAKAEQTIGASLSAEQRRAAEGICASGRGAELVVGVAGAGKTTMLSVVAAAFEASGCQVIGTATSGQAASTLGREAEIGEARTLASLVWRLDDGRLTLDERTVVILDEAGMTEDAHLVALTARIEAAGAKLVTVGDHQQLGAVGPGGALAALVRRHPDVVHHLTENRRQHDPAERHALAELRDGEVADAVAWYDSNGRVHPVCEREDALQGAVDAWAADVAAGHETGLYAWRRANVAALNDRARTWMENTDRLSGPELIFPGGNAYRAGDRVVTLAPGPEGALVTSQRAVVESVDRSQQNLVLRTDEGRRVLLRAEEAAADRLAYGYATTVHRAQGATTERAHLFADGGGRELAYVAMSRARESTHVWAVADNLPQAVDDLRRDWSTRRTPTWAIDTALPDLATLRREDSRVALRSDQQAHFAALLHAERVVSGNAVAGIGLPDRAATIGQAEQALEAARQARRDLETGSGVWASTEVGRVVRDLAEARTARQRAESTSEHGDRRRDRRAGRRDAAEWARRETAAQQRFDAIATPEIVELDKQLARHEADLNEAAARYDRRRVASTTVIEHGFGEQRQARRLAERITAERSKLDGVASGAESRQVVSWPRPGHGWAAQPELPTQMSPGIEL
ncbi:MAG: AAA family ATPase, partial [Acidimicrobiaceae bacterium]|nr:AAA family ATPase [Acidimicrobiaceae bacterium]